MEDWKKRRRKKKAVSITIPDELLQEVDKIARKYGVTRTQIITNALVEVIERIERESKK